MASNSACSSSSGGKTAVSPALPFADTAKRLQLVLLGRGIHFHLVHLRGSLSCALRPSLCLHVRIPFFFIFGLAAERPSIIDMTLE